MLLLMSHEKRYSFIPIKYSSGLPAGLLISTKLRTTTSIFTNLLIQPLDVIPCFYLQLQSILPKVLRFAEQLNSTFLNETLVQRLAKVFYFHIFFHFVVGFFSTRQVKMSSSGNVGNTMDERIRSSNRFTRVQAVK